jgi:hypothetical protein
LFLIFLRKLLRTRSQRRGKKTATSTLLKSQRSVGRDSVGGVGPDDWDMGTVGSRPLEERNPGFGLVPVKWAPKLLALLFAFCAGRSGGHTRAGPPDPY